MRCCTCNSAGVCHISIHPLPPQIILFLDWRRPPYPVNTADYATYVQIVSWFFDTPSPQAPFSIHRMALAGKELGKDVGQWFGPSTAAGAIKCVYILPPCYLLTVSQDSCSGFPRGRSGSCGIA